MIPSLHIRQRNVSPRRHSGSDDDIVSSDALRSPPLKQKIKTKKSQRKSGSNGKPDTPEFRQKKPPKLKHLVHVHANPVDFEDQFVTQAADGEIPSSPWRLRGPIWVKPVQPQQRPASPSPRDNISSSLPELAQQHTHASRQKQQEPVENWNNIPALEISREVSIPPEQLSNPPPKSPLPRPTSMISALDFDVEQELADLPSDAFESSPDSSPHRPNGSHQDVIELSSQVEFTSPRRPNLAVPKTGFQQMTLFGTTAQSNLPVAQTTKKPNWPLANKEEPPTHHQLNLEAMKTYIYPKNLGKRRDYQYSIVRRGLFHNLLVALPTGLGKTFIAATIMLNWFRWTVNAQIVFVAPTKPLVSQQVEACFGVAGIPKSQTAMLTGGVGPGYRAEEWNSKRVFFTTPQTFSNDLKSGIADPKRIVLLVVDEAHRATGNYSYVELVTILRRFNSSFRLLALTATPGASIEAVQEVINGLKISRIEIRTEFSIDIREYIHSKDTESFLFDNSEDMEFVIDLFSKALSPVLQKLRSQQAYWTADPMQLSPYGIMQARKRWMDTAGRNANSGIKAMVNRLFTVLASIAHNIELLKYHGIGPFYHNMVIFRNANTGRKAGKYEKEILESEPFMKMMTHIGMWIKDDNFLGHPKLDHLQQVVLNHFVDAGDGALGGNGETPPATRVMIFASYRDSAEEICRVLKRHSPMIRPHVFVGQQSSKGSEGMNQSRQLNVIEEFKKGIYNTLVATSIGEEGLDIGEIDLIICYDSSSSPIRMLQRIGRTGRKRAGKVCLLLMRGKEENSIVKAKDNYEKIQKLIADGNQFEFHEETARRIVPKDINPFPDERVVEIPIENTQAGLPEPKRRGRAPKRPPKKFHMPDGVITGFMTASRMNGGGSDKEEARPAKRKRAAPIAGPVEELEPLTSLSDVMLTTKQEEDLIERYQNLPIDDEFDCVIARPCNTNYPERQRRVGPTYLLKHSETTKGAVQVLNAMRKVSMHRIGMFQRLSRTNMDELLQSPRMLESDAELSDQCRPYQTVMPASKSRKPRAPNAKATPAEGLKFEARVAPKPKATRKFPASKAKTNAPTKSSRIRSYEASVDDMEDSGSCATPLSQSMELATQGIDLGSDTSGDDELEGEPSSQLRRFVVDDDEEIEEDLDDDDLLPSSPPVGRSPAIRKSRPMQAAFDENDESDEDENMPSLNTLLQNRKRKAEEVVFGNNKGKRTRRIIGYSSD